MAELTENPVCPGCGTNFNRHEVERQLWHQSPFLFDSASWTTKFRCVSCGDAVTISGQGAAEEGTEIGEGEAEEGGTRGD